MRISPYIRRYLNPDLGGAPAAPSAEPVATPPPAAPSPAPGPAAPPAGGDTKPERTAAEKELDDFTPQEFHDGDEPPPAKPDPKVKAPEKPPVAPPPKTDDKKPGELPDNAPAAKIRERLKEVEKERDTWKQKAETPSPKLGELEGQLAELRAEKESLTKDIDLTRQELAMHDPYTSQKVRDLEKEFDAKVEKQAQFMPELKSEIGALVAEFAEIRKDPANYPAALKDFRAKIGDIVGPENAASALGLIADGLEFLSNRDGLVKEIKEGGAKIHFGSQVETWKKNVDLTTQHLAAALETVPDFETVQPYHPINFVKRALETFDDTQKAGQKQWEDNADSYIKFAANGVSPEALSKLQNLPPKERADRLAKIESERIEAAKWVRTHAKQAAFYNRFLPGILADYARLLEADKKRAAGQPPSPNEGKGGSPTEDFGEDIHKMGKTLVPDI